MLPTPESGSAIKKPAVIPATFLPSCDNGQQHYEIGRHFAFAVMMQKMMGWQGQGCDCTTQRVMSQMMAMCSAVQDETEEETGAEVNQKA